MYGQICGNDLTYDIHTKITRHRCRRSRPRSPSPDEPEHGAVRIRSGVLRADQAAIPGDRIRAHLQLPARSAGPGPDVAACIVDPARGRLPHARAVDAEQTGTVDIARHIERICRVGLPDP